MTEPLGEKAGNKHHHLLLFFSGLYRAGHRLRAQWTPCCSDDGPPAGLLLSNITLREYQAYFVGTCSTFNGYPVNVGLRRRILGLQT